jgi:hypothetical protein
MSLPQNVGDSMAELARLSDEMWFLAGDKSVDFSWYTKRATLSAVYASSGFPSSCQCWLVEVFMTTDNSENFQDTWGTIPFDSAKDRLSWSKIERCTITWENNEQYFRVPVIYHTCYQKYCQLPWIALLEESQLLKGKSTVLKWRMLYN